MLVGKVEPGLWINQRRRWAVSWHRTRSSIWRKNTNVTVAWWNGETPEIIDIGMVGEIIGINPLVIDLDQEIN